MSTEQFERGLKIRTEVLGEDHVKASFEGADNFNREGEDGAAIEAAITAFIEGEASARAAQR